MPSALSSLGVATLCFFIPMMLACVFVCYKARRSPVPAAWFLLVLVCLIRIAGAILSFITPNPNIGVDAATFALLSAGGLPLLLLMVLLLSHIAKTEFSTDQRAHYAIVALRLLFLTTLALTIAGVRMHAQKDSPDVVRIGQRVAEAGAIVSLALLEVSFCGDVFLWCRYGRVLERNSRKILAANVVASGFLAVRLVYFCLAIFTAESVGSRWNPITGSVAALICMVLIPEFIVVLVYVCVGLTIDGSMGEDNDQSCTRRVSSKSDDETSPA